MKTHVRFIGFACAIAILAGCREAPSGDVAGSGEPFVTVWHVTAASPTVMLPVNSRRTYRYSVDWGDGRRNTDVTQSATHRYEHAGDYTVTISGTFPQLRMVAGDPLSIANRREEENAAKLIRVVRWGDIAWQSMRNMFAHCANLQIDTATHPRLEDVHSMRNMFAGAARFDGDIGDWNVSSVTDMHGMFYEASRFNHPVNHWHVASVTDMSSMFAFARHFNQPLDDWNVSSVTSMQAMFKGAAAFDQPIGSWNVSHVVTMAEMFAYAKHFNQSLGDWNVSSVTDMRRMFRFAKSFRAHDLTRWNLASLKKSQHIFSGSGGDNRLTAPLRSPIR